MSNTENATSATSTPATSTPATSTSGNQDQMVNRSPFSLNLAHARDVLLQSTSSTKMTEEEQQKLLQEQAQAVESYVKTLSAQNPSTTFQLEHPLQSLIHKGLLEKGYSVSTTSSYQNVNGVESRDNQVTVSLEGVMDSRVSPFHKNQNYCYFNPYIPFVYARVYPTRPNLWRCLGW